MTDPRPRLRDFDSAERYQKAQAFLYPTAAGIVFGTIAALYLMETKGIGLGRGALVVALGGLVGAGLGGLAWLVTGRLSRGLIGLLTAGGNIRPAPSFSLQESLVMRGRYQEAAQAYRDHLAEMPADDDARLALAALLATHLADSTGAERLLREILGRRGGERAHWAAGNALIDLYRATGQRGRLLAELARFAERYRGTAAGDAAKRELLALKGEIAT
jgi:hypothetical protein